MPVSATATSEQFGQRYLRTPELFPARQSGEPCGNVDITTQLGGVVYSLEGLSAEQAEAVRRGFPAPEQLALPREAETPTTRIRFFRAFAGDFLEAPDDREFFGLDFDYQPGRVRVAGARVMLLLDLDPLLSAAVFLPPGDGELEPHSRSMIANAYRIVAAYRAIADGNLLLHSCALLEGDGCWVFSGHSNAGKTTLAREWLDDGGRVLSDDLNAVFRDASGRWHAQAAPFSGRVPLTTTDPVPLRGVYRLKQAEATTVANVQDTRWIASIAAGVPFVNADLYRFDTVLNGCQKLGRSSSGGTITRRLGDLSFCRQLEKEAGS